jgi:hypothetical protein
MGTETSNRIFRKIDRFARQAWRGWEEADMNSLMRKLDDPAAYRCGIIKISKREYRAWAALNRSILESKQPVSRSSLLAWVEGRGLYPTVRVTVVERDEPAHAVERIDGHMTARARKTERGRQLRRPF